MEIMAPTKAAAIRARELTKSALAQQEESSPGTPPAWLLRKCPGQRVRQWGLQKRSGAESRTRTAPRPGCMAERIRGSRISQTICDCVLSAPCPVRMSQDFPHRQVNAACVYIPNQQDKHQRRQQDKGNPSIWIYAFFISYYSRQLQPDANRSGPGSPAILRQSQWYGCPAIRSPSPMALLEQILPGAPHIAPPAQP